jgi:hypothetical protein
VTYSVYGNEYNPIIKYFGNDIDAILDMLPTAEILDEENGVYTVSAEVFGKGIEMWLRSQGNQIERIE